jgi:hypothetical protein
MGGGPHNFFSVWLASYDPESTWTPQFGRISAQS